MFDWFRDMAEEFAGIDSVAARKERMEKKERKKLDRFIFSAGAKIGTIIMGLIYVGSAAGSAAALKTFGSIDGWQLAKHISLSIVAIVVIFSLLFGKKRGEMIALGGVFVFVVGMFLSMMLA